MTRAPCWAGAWQRWRFEAGRAGRAALAAPPVTLAAVLGLLLLMAATGWSQRRLAQFAAACVEAVPPLLAATATATATASDPARELQLSLPASYRATLARRVAVACAWPAALAAASVLALAAAGWWPAALGAAGGQLAWLSPLAWLAALAALAAAALRAAPPASALAGAVWVLELLLAGAFLARDWLRPLHLFATTLGPAAGLAPAAGWWLANRLALLGAALALGALAWALLGRPERLLAGEGGE